MPSGDTFIRHLFGGGFATDLGPNTDAAPQSAGGGISQIVIPFLTQADNIMFELDGGFTKSPGTTKINSAALESGAAIRGNYDFWIQGTTGTPVQHRVVHVGTKIKADNADGTFADIATGVSSTAVPSYATFNDTLIISDDGNSAPLKWSGTGSTSTLGGTPPNFAFCVEHKGRLFAAGVASNPSRLYYSDAFDHESGWSNYITIGTNDGSMITGLASYKNALVIFKGPKKGSIHVLSGNSPSDFSLARLRKDCGSAVWQNAIFQFGDDLAFVAADGSIQTLSATAAFGSFSLGYLTRDISKYINGSIVRTQLRKCWAVNWEARGLVLFTMPTNFTAYPNVLLAMDYRFGDAMRFSPWPAYAGVCNSAHLATDEDDNSRAVVVLGGNDGFLRKLDVNAFAIDGSTAITSTVKTPNLSYGSPHLTKTPTAGSIAFQPLTDDNVTFTYHRDNQTATSLSINQGGGDFLAPSSGTDFTLDSSVLGGGQYSDVWFEIENGGEVRSLAYELSNGDLDANISIHSLSIFLRGANLSLENAA